MPSPASTSLYMRTLSASGSRRASDDEKPSKALGKGPDAGMARSTLGSLSSVQLPPEILCESQDTGQSPPDLQPDTFVIQPDPQRCFLNGWITTAECAWFHKSNNSLQMEAIWKCPWTQAGLAKIGCDYKKGEKNISTRKTESMWVLNNFIPIRILKHYSFGNY